MSIHNSDYILVYRNELLEWTFERAATCYLWMFLRLKAATQPRLQTVGRRAITVKVDFGQYATSKTYLSLTLNMDDRTIDSILNDLVADGLIEITDKTIYIIITIKDYDKYCPHIGVLPQTIWSPIPVADTEATKVLETAEQSNATGESDSTELSSMVNSMPDSTPQNSPESPIIIEEDKKKENNISTTASNARASEEEFFERLRNSPAELEVIKTELKLKTVDEVLHQLNVFQMFISGKNEHHDNYGHFTSHFMSWHRKYTASKAYKKSAPKQGSGQPPRYEKPRNWRDNLGISSNAVTIADYEEPI